jgi:tRNA(Arg) A34 adenosine deaminase TadA
VTGAAATVPTRFQLDLPAWVVPWLDDQPSTLPTDDDRTGLVLDLAGEHVERGTGGPFAAGIFDGASGRLLAVGVNLVVPSRACIAHAEMVAFALAGQGLGGFDLGAASPVVLVASTEPCAMCLGAIPWSGVSRVVCSARDEDARAIGFDEGLKPPGWTTHLEASGIGVVRDVRRDEGRAVLQRYAALGGDVYCPADARG